MIALNFFALIFFITPSVGAACQNGMEEKEGGLWHVCSKGTLTPVACISATEDRVDEGSSFQDQNYIYTCSKSPENPKTLRLVAVACLNKGVLVEPEHVFYKNRTELWRCNRVGAELKAQPAGCMDNNAQPMSENAQVVRDNLVYTCQGGTLKPTGCMFGNDKFAVGSDVVVSTIFYRCEAKPSNGLVALKLKGCVENGTKYEFGKQFSDFWFAYECQPMGGTAMRVGVACIERYPNGTVAQYKPGEKWLVGANDFNRYQILCRKQGLTIRRQGVACFYTTRDGQGLLVGGCMRKVGFQVIQCTAPTPQTPNVRIRITENPTPADWDRLRGTGLKEC